MTGMSAETDLVTRLRERDPRDCPFEGRSPIITLEPEDPCPVCHGYGTDGAEDKCISSPGPLLKEAADKIAHLLRVNADQLRVNEALAAALELLAGDLQHRHDMKNTGSRNSAGDIVHGRDGFELLDMRRKLQKAIAALALHRGES